MHLSNKHNETMKPYILLRNSATWSLILFGLCGTLKGAEPTTAAEDEYTYSTGATVDRYLYTSKIAKSAIVRTGSVSPGSPLPEGIGVIAAGEKARAAFEALEVGDHSQWLLHSVGRKNYAGAGWVYYAAFVKRTERQPDYIGNQLQITVLLDGTVIPVQQQPNPGPEKTPDAQSGPGE